VDGGKTEFVRVGAFAAKESSSGYLYHARGPNVRGLFRVRLPGGAEELVLPELGIGMWGSWALGKDKVYFIDWMDAAKRAAGVQVYEPNVGTRASRTALALVVLSKNSCKWWIVSFQTR